MKNPARPYRRKHAEHRDEAAQIEDRYDGMHHMLMDLRVRMTGWAEGREPAPVLREADMFVIFHALAVASNILGSGIERDAMDKVVLIPRPIGQAIVDICSISDEYQRPLESVSATLSTIHSLLGFTEAPLTDSLIEDYGRPDGKLGARIRAVMTQTGAVVGSIRDAMRAARAPSPSGETH